MSTAVTVFNSENTVFKEEQSFKQEARGYSQKTEASIFSVLL